MFKVRQRTCEAEHCPLPPWKDLALGLHVDVQTGPLLWTVERVSHSRPTSTANQLLNQLIFCTGTGATLTLPSHRRARGLLDAAGIAWRHRSSRKLYLAHQAGGKYSAAMVS